MDKQRRNPYVRLMRLHQPVGIWLLLWPCWWSLALASDGFPDIIMLTLFALGALVMRSAGCIINDIADRDFDRQVERTRARPLASGELTLRQAILLLTALLFLSLIVAVMLGASVVLWAALSLPLVATYPLMKRITWWPQLFLGLTFNWGALIGWVAMQGEIEWPAMILYAGGVFWTLGYDTIYAHQDKKDDARIGVKSTALRLGNKTKPVIFVFYTLSALLWLMAGAEALLLVPVYAHFLWQILTVDLSSPVSCLSRFKSNMWLGLLIFIAFLSGS